MAVYTGKFHEQDIIPGQRVQKTYDANPSSVTSTGQTVVPALVGRQGVMLLGQLKPFPYLTYSTPITDGTLVPTGAVDPNRTYRILPVDIHGTLISSLTEARMINPGVNIGARDVKVLSGVGAQSVMFEQKPTTPEQKSIRRWPRDWHGENMN